MASLCTSSTVNKTPCVVAEVSTLLDLRSLDEADTQTQRPLISKELALRMEVVFQITLFTATSIVGVLSNTVNIIVYWRQGLRDSVTVGLFALSLSDFFVVFCPLLTAVCFAADHLYPSLPINLRAIAEASTIQLHHLFYSLSCSLTAFLSIERCMCVVKPLHVRIVFTRKRTIIALFVLLCFFVLAYTPIFFASRIAWQVIPGTNSSKILTVRYHHSSRDIEAYHNSVITIFVPTASQFIVTCTAFVMIDGLRKASKFRQMVARVNTHTQTNDTTPTTTTSTTTTTTTDSITTTADSTTTTSASTQDVYNEQEDYTKIENTDQKNIEILNCRDARLVKTVVILATILSVANVPYVAFEYVQIFVPEMNPGMRFQNTFRLISSINFLLVAINASINAFVYYFNGSKYRKTVKDLFC